MPSAPSPHYDRLSAQDATFLDLEGPTAPQHVAATMVLRSGSLRTPEGGIDIERIRAYVGLAAAPDPALPPAPRLRAAARITRSGSTTTTSTSDYHVRHTALPQPGDRRQLKRLSGRILSQQLDRPRPLWELWVVEGLEGATASPIVQKAHHSRDRRHLGRRPDRRAAPRRSLRRLRAGAALAAAPGAAGQRAARGRAAPPRRRRRGAPARPGPGRAARAARLPAPRSARARRRWARPLAAGFRPASPHAPQPSARHAPALRLARHRARRREAREGPPRRHRERRGARHGRRRAAPLPRAAPRRRRRPPDPRERAGERAGRRGARAPRQPDRALDDADLPVAEPDPLARLARVRETTARLKASRQALGRRGARGGERLDELLAALARRPRSARAPRLQPGRHQRARPPDPPLPARRAMSRPAIRW